MPNIGPLEIGLVLIVALIVFGPKKLPELGNSLGKGIREFKGSISGDAPADRPSGSIDEEPPPAAARAHETRST
jgi:sec-independent protein translocase protein TatA